MGTSERVYRAIKSKDLLGLLVQCYRTNESVYKLWELPLCAAYSTRIQNTRNERGRLRMQALLPPSSRLGDSENLEGEVADTRHKPSDRRPQQGEGVDPYISRMVNSAKSLSDCESVILDCGLHMRPHHVTSLIRQIAVIDLEGMNPGRRQREALRILCKGLVSTLSRQDGSALARVIQALGKVAYAPEGVVAQVAGELVGEPFFKLAQCGVDELAEVAYALARLEAVYGQVLRLSPRKSSPSAEATAMVKTPSVDLLWSAISQLSINAAEKLTGHSIAKLAWSFARAKLRDDELYDTLATAAIHQILHIEPVDLTSILWGFSVVGHRHPELFSAAAHVFVLNKSKFPNASFASVLWSFASFDYYDEDLCYAASMVASKRIKYLTLEQLVQTMWSFSSLRHMDEILIKKLRRAIKVYKGNLETKQVVTLLASVVEINAKSKHHDELVGELASLLDRRLLELSAADLHQALVNLGTASAFSPSLLLQAREALAKLQPNDFTSQQLADLHHSWVLAKGQMLGGSWKEIKARLRRQGFAAPGDAGFSLAEALSIVSTNQGLPPRTPPAALLEATSSSSGFHPSDPFDLSQFRYARDLGDYYDYNDEDDEDEDEDDVDEVPGGDARAIGDGGSTQRTLFAGTAETLLLTDKGAGKKPGWAQAQEAPKGVQSTPEPLGVVRLESGEEAFALSRENGDKGTVVESSNPIAAESGRKTLSADDYGSASRVDYDGEAGKSQISSDLERDQSPVFVPEFLDQCGAEVSDNVRKEIMDLWHMLDALEEEVKKQSEPFNKVQATRMKRILDGIRKKLKSCGVWVGGIGHPVLEIFRARKVPMPFWKERKPESGGPSKKGEKNPQRLLFDKDTTNKSTATAGPTAEAPDGVRSTNGVIIAPNAEHPGGPAFTNGASVTPSVNPPSSSAHTDAAVATPSAKATGSPVWEPKTPADSALTNGDPATESVGAKNMSHSEFKSLGSSTMNIDEASGTASAAVKRPSVWARKAPTGSSTSTQRHEVQSVGSNVSQSEQSRSTAVSAGGTISHSRASAPAVMSPGQSDLSLERDLSEKPSFRGDAAAELGSGDARQSIVASTSGPAVMSGSTFMPAAISSSSSPSSVNASTVATAAACTSLALTGPQKETSLTEPSPSGLSTQLDIFSTFSLLPPDLASAAYDAAKAAAKSTPPRATLWEQEVALLAESVGLSPMEGLRTRDGSVSVDLSIVASSGRVCIERLGRSAFSRSRPHTLTGATERRIRLLKLDGWNVVTITHYEWKGFADQDEQLAWLLNCLHEKRVDLKELLRK